MSRTQIPEQPTGAHWGEYASTSALPNASSGPVTNHLNVGDLASVLGELYCCTSPGGSGDGTVSSWTEVSLSGGSLSGGLTLGGDIEAAGGFRQTIGPFTAPGAAGVTAAAQTDLDLRYSHTVTVASGRYYVATRAGSIVGLSAAIEEPVEGTDQSIVVSATIDGEEVGLTASLTEAGGETEAVATAAKDVLTFAAGALLGISYTSDTITNTPALVASLEIES